MNRGLRAPDFAQASIAAAAGPVGVIVLRVLLVIILVVLLRGPERREGENGRDDRPLQAFPALDRPLRCLGASALGRTAEEDRGSVLFSAVAELSVVLCRIDVVPVDV